MKFLTHEVDDHIALVHFADARGAWGTRGRHVFFRATGESSWQPIGSFPRDQVVDTLGIGRLARRLLRTEKCNVYPTRAGGVLGIRQGRVYQLGRTPDEPARLIFSIRGDCVMSRAIAESSDGSLFFGEYFMNPERVPARIWCLSPDLKSHRLAYAFDHPRPRHVHGVHRDPFAPERLWVTLGDFRGECYLAYTDNHFATLHFLGDGTQHWRIVGLIFQEDRLCWLTDSHIEQNYVVSMARSSHSIQLHGMRSASSWYAAESSDGRYLATTTVEPGPSIQSRSAFLLTSEDGLNWKEVASFRKDVYPMRGFGFGSLWLPAGEFASTDFWLSGEGVRDLDCRSQRCGLQDSR